MEKINRRDFLKTLGVGAAGAAVASCTPKKDSLYDPKGNHTEPVPVGQMTYRTHNVSGNKVSILGYGCMRWPMIPNPNGRGQIIDQEQVNRLVDYALEHGVNYFDTAPVYGQGQSEGATGTALARHPRNDYFIATKMSNHNIAQIPDISDAEVYRRSVEMYENSFKELKTDYIDYYLLHSIGGQRGMWTNTKRFFSSGVLDFLVEEKKKGKIRNLGFSWHGDIEVFNYMLQLHDEGKYHWDFVQIQMNYLDWTHATGRNTNAEYLYEELNKRDIMAVIMEPLLGGRLSDLPQHVIARLKQRRPDDSAASWAFRWVGSYPNVLSVLSGMTYLEHLQDNIRSYAPLVEVTDEDKEFLEETADLIMKYPLINCNNCEYCMPCPYGIDIPGVLLHYNKCVNDGNLPSSQGDPEYRKMRQAFLVGYDRRVPKLRQADHCTGCNQCSPLCPQRIDIPAQMQRVNDFAEKLRQNTL
ncbi:MAG: aldo/keto reductase [Bacteroidaceae bacterium]|nr:aldo/keto reductase [Bacteroidaceae bacterium]